MGGLIDHGREENEENEVLRCSVSKSTINSHRYGRRRTRPCLFSDGRRNVDKLIDHLPELQEYSATKDLIANISKAR